MTIVGSSSISGAVVMSCGRLESSEKLGRTFKLSLRLWMEQRFWLDVAPRENRSRLDIEIRSAWYFDNKNVLLDYCREMGDDLKVIRYFCFGDRSMV